MASSLQPPSRPALVDLSLLPAGSLPPPPGGASYVPTFVVLGVIAALAAVACFVGQVWARRCLRPKTRRGYDAEEGGLGTSVPPAGKPAENGGAKPPHAR
ncbi:unnamed protein product [Spirodela intermedia]|uniref:Uncharacterized protein n=1 Tax=Spirodela intermedia TaxID=51605 RepID=A0A7I8LJQ0_SPIIN|nr:unnamed protein product [Spirodela intermedia]